MSKKKRLKWDELTSEQRKALIALADSLFISPMFVADMYEQGSLALPDDES